MPLAVPWPLQSLLAKKVKLTVPVGSTPATESDTVALSCTLVPSATDELSAITASLALLCSSVAVEDGALVTTLDSFASPHAVEAVLLCWSPV